MLRRQMLMFAMALLMLAGLYVAMRPARMAGPAAATDICSANNGSMDAAAAVPQQFGGTLRVSVDAPSPVAMMVHQGDLVSLEVQSSRDGEVTVHGLSEASHGVAAGELAHISVPATTPGTYAVHFHGPSGEHVALALINIQTN